MDPFARAAANRDAVVAVHGAVGAGLGGLVVGTEADRVLAIPRVDRTADTDAAAAARWSRLLGRRGGRPLRPIQGATLDAIAREAALGTPYGVFGAIGVGHGKTLTAMLAGTAAGAERPLMLYPPSMRSQWRADVAEWSAEYNFETPRDMAYSELSDAKASTFLDYYRPDLLIADEAHALRHATAARTKRVARYLREHPECRVLLLSGTITGRSLLDHAHLLEWVLRDRTPLPLHRQTLEKWASVVDPGGWPDHDSIDSIWPLARANGAASDWRALPLDVRQTTARDGYRARFVSIPGVITTTDGSVGASLNLVARDAADIAASAPSGEGVPDIVSRALRGLLDRWELPTHDAAGNAIDAVGGEHGEEVVDAARMAAASSNLSAGFFYRWAWSGGTPSEVEREWLERRRAYHREVRGTLQHAEAGRDSPLLLARWLHAGNGSGPLRVAFDRWHALIPPPAVGIDPSAWEGRAVCYADLEPPPVVPVWLSPYLVEDVLRVVAEHRRRGASLLVWYASRAMEAALSAAGLPVFGAGSESPDFAKLSARTSSVSPKVSIAACSITVHGKGKNLQAWAHNLVVEPPAGGIVWEQLLGRTHRQGQEADEVEAIVYQHTDRTVDALRSATADALYIEQTQGTKQKLNYARWSDGDAPTAKGRGKTAARAATAAATPDRGTPPKDRGGFVAPAAPVPVSSAAAGRRRALFG